MAVDICGDRGFGMAQSSGDNDGRNPVIQHDAGCRVAQIVEPEILDPRLPEVGRQ